jgi:AcrR family transcriptional regulator
MEETVLGRREENKQRTRSALESAAARLFEERGFDGTTVRDIAAAAGVGERTFFRYFPSKEDLVFQEIRNLLPGLMQRVRERPAEERLLTALLEAMLEWLDETGSPPTILVTGPPKAPGQQHDEGHLLIYELETAISEAFLDRLVAAGAKRDAHATVLRAAVQSRAGVAAMRGMMAASPHGDLCEADLPPAQTSGLRSTKVVGNMLREAFAALEP